MKKYLCRLLILLIGVLFLASTISGCRPATLTQEKPVTGGLAFTNTSTPAPLPTNTPRPTLPATWTPAPLTPTRSLAPTGTPIASPEYRQTLIALTTVAAGIHCQRHPEAWQVYTGPASAFAGWCQVVGTLDTLYEYRLYAPDGWVVNTFGELAPNLSFSTGKKNVNVRLYQAYAYGTYNFTGPLEKAPEQARICDENARCYGFVGPHEIIIRQQANHFETRDAPVLKAFETRDLLVLDSRIDSPAGKLFIHRYYQFIPFNLYKKQTERLFILEMTWLEGALTDAEHTALLEKLELMALSINQR